MDRRIKHIDIAKGLSITLVVMFHSSVKDYFPEVVDPMSLFRMPLFFLLSGIFFSWTMSSREFLLKKSEALLKPYFSVLLLIFILSYLRGDESLGYQLKGLFYGNGPTIKWTPLWFLTHLFAVYCFVFTLARAIKLFEISKILTISILIALIVTGSIWVDYFWYREIYVFSEYKILPGLPFSADILFITSSYFIAGRLLKSQLINFYPNWWLFALSLTVFFVISEFTTAYIDLNRRVYNNPLFATLGAIIGIYMIFMLSFVISKSHWIGSFVQQVGKASLYILIFHYPIMKMSEYFYTIVQNKDLLPFLSFVSLGIGIVAPLLIKWIIEHNDILSLAFLPFRSNKLLQRLLRLRQ